MRGQYRSGFPVLEKGLGVVQGIKQALLVLGRVEAVAKSGVWRKAGAEHAVLNHIRATGWVRGEP